MEEEGFEPVHVAPLRIRKSQKDLRDNVEDTQMVDTRPQYNKELPEQPCDPRPKFQNFLRACYPFQPQGSFASTSVTIPLSAGDIVLVHTIHTNGWADGTLLETGARGWLPTNYCEPYDYATMRPLLKALTEFWDIIRSDAQPSSELYRTHDYMRGMVAGVRFLLEKSNCLTRDAQLVKRHDSIRKTRKGLLADLSLLVKASKGALDEGFNPSSGDFDEKVSDDLLLKAFQVVTRAVNFFDIWSEEVAFIEAQGPGSGSSFSPEPLSPSDSSTVHGTAVYNFSKRNSLYRSQSSASGPSIHSFSRPRPASISRPPTVTHRMSYTGRSFQINRGNYASEQLSDTYDAFLGVLASFLGSHLQSRSSSELLLTTQQAVKSCRKLLEIIEIILEHEHSDTEDLQEAKDTMYDNITALVHAAREVFRPIRNDDDDMIYLPGEGALLVDAATTCVRGAGRCVAKAKVLLEEIGDFEIELRNDISEVASPFDTASLSPYKPTHDLDHISAPSSRRQSIPHLEIPKEAAAAMGPGALSATPTPSNSSFWTPMTEATGSPTSEVSTEATAAEVTNQAPTQRSLARAMLHGSESTLVSSARDSGPSFMSQTSTRATSPDSHAKGSPHHPDDNGDDIEDALHEHQFAHELVIGEGGKLVGGTLNAIVERLTSHDATPDSGFLSTVYLTFRLFATPMEFAQALVYRFDYIELRPAAVQPVRLRVSNVFKGWLEAHWRHDCDEVTIPFIMKFVEEKVITVSSSAANRLLDLINIVRTTHGPAVPRVLSSIGKTNTASTSKNDPDQPAPAPVLSRSQLNSLKLWKMGGSGLSVLDFEPLELARQLTIKTSLIFCSILPEELLGCEFTKQSSSLAVNLRALSQLSNDVSNLVIDSILLLEDTKKRAAVIKQWVKIAAKCLELHNYESLITINGSLNNTAVLRLRKTWDMIGQKTKGLHELHNEVCSHAKNYAGLRQRFEKASLPCLPYVGIYRTDLIFTDQGMPATRDLQTAEGSVAVINLTKHSKTASIISDLQRFQIPYKLTSVDELQTWMQDECIRVRAAGDRNVQNQYRRSLILEPKLDAPMVPQATKIKAFASMATLTSKDKFEFLTWSNSNKENRDLKDKERNNSVGTI